PPAGVATPATSDPPRCRRGSRRCNPASCLPIPSARRGGGQLPAATPGILVAPGQLDPFQAGPRKPALEFLPPEIEGGRGHQVVEDNVVVLAEIEVGEAG